MTFGIHNIRHRKLALIIAAVCSGQVVAQEKAIERIEVRAARADITTQITEEAEKLIDMPGSMGDPLRAVYALPGVVAAGGSMSEPAVRGSSPNDNLFEVDFMPAGYIFHNFGNSIFNPNIIQDFRLLSAGYGSGYSNATGAVFDVALRDPKQQALQTTVALSLLNAGIFVEGQVSDNSAGYFSARKSLVPFYLSEGEELEEDNGNPEGITINNPPDDNDYQGKWVWHMNDRNSLALSVTGAQDSAGVTFDERSQLSYSNPEYLGDADFIRRFDSQNLIWDHFGDDFTLKLGIGAMNNSERLDYGRRSPSSGHYQDYSHQQFTYKARLNYHLNADHGLRLDAAYFDSTYEADFDMYRYLCTETDPDCDLNRGERIRDKVKVGADNAFIGLTHIWQVSDQLQTELGGQWQYNHYTDEHFLLPRLALNYYLTDDSTITARYGHYNRMPDLETIAPVIGNPALKSQSAKHASLGFSQHLDNDWSWSLEGYYKRMDDLPLALANDDTGAHYSNEVEGRAYGMDLLINKNKTDNWYGWFSIGYSKSERTDQRHNLTSDYYADTPLVMNLVYNYQINERWNAGFNFTARSGQAYTPIIGLQDNPAIPGQLQPLYGEAYSKRSDFYHRLDIRAERKTDFFGMDAKLVFELINAYNSQNLSGEELDYASIKAIDSDNGGHSYSIMRSKDDFQFMPSIGFSVTF